MVAVGAEMREDAGDRLQSPVIPELELELGNYIVCRALIEPETGINLINARLRG